MESPDWWSAGWWELWPMRVPPLGTIKETTPRGPVNRGSEQLKCLLTLQLINMIITCKRNQGLQLIRPRVKSLFKHTAGRHPSSESSCYLGQEVTRDGCRMIIKRQNFSFTIYWYYFLNNLVHMETTQKHILLHFLSSLKLF